MSRYCRLNNTDDQYRLIETTQNNEIQKKDEVELLRLKKLALEFDIKSNIHTRFKCLNVVFDEENENAFWNAYDEKCSEYSRKYGGDFNFEELSDSESELRRVNNALKKIIIKEEPVQLNTYKFEDSGNAPEAKHQFEPFSIIDSNVRSINELFSILNTRGEIAHRLSDSRFLWISGWIWGKTSKCRECAYSYGLCFNCLKFGYQALQFLKEVWDWPIFNPFLTEEQVWIHQKYQQTTWSIRLSTSVPRVVRISTRALDNILKTNRGYNVGTAVKICHAIRSVMVILNEIFLVDGVAQLVMHYNGPPCWYENESVCRGQRS